MRLSLSQKQYGVELYGENLLNDRGQIFPNPVNFATRTVPRTIGLRGTVCAKKGDPLAWRGC